MMSRAIAWPKVTLEDAEVDVFDCEHKTPARAARGVPYISIPEMKEGRLDVSKARLVDAVDVATWNRRVTPKEGDVLLSRRTNPGVTAVVPPNLPCVLGQNLVILRSRGTKVDQGFLRWVTRSPEWWQQIQQNLNVGAVFDSLRCADIPHFELSIPPLAEQYTIAAILGALDDKIELNQRMSATLEGMARAIFKSWFVDFEPVRAKAEGRDAGVPRETADLFPERLVDSEVGEIPAGWAVRPLGGLLELVYGEALKEPNRRLGTIPVFGSNGQVGWHDEKLANGPGIIVGRKGNPGIITWAPTDFFAIDTTFYVVPKPDCRSLYFLFYALKTHNLGSLGADSAVPGLNRNMAYMSEQVVPPVALLAEFDRVVETLFQRMHHAGSECGTLADLRDTLLPKLISGELRVSDPGSTVDSQGMA